MTENEIKNTKKWFEDFIKTYALSNQETIEFQKAVACLEEIQQYRAIGTIEEFKALKEKNVAKKIVVKKNKDITFFLCPQCNKVAGNSIMRVESSHCSGCGQKLDWSE